MASRGIAVFGCAVTGLLSLRMLYAWSPVAHTSNPNPTSISVLKFPGAAVMQWAWPALPVVPTLVPCQARHTHSMSSRLNRSVATAIDTGGSVIAVCSSVGYGTATASLDISFARYGSSRFHKSVSLMRPQIGRRPTEVMKISETDFLP